MKTLTNLFAAMMMCICCATTTTSCSDDNDEPVIPAAANVAGTYNGNMTCSVMGQESTFDDVTFKIENTDEATVNISVSAFGEPPMLVPGLKITGVMVSGADGAYTLAETEFTGTTNTGKTYSGILQGTFADNTLSVRINLTYGAMPMPMILSFSAPKN